MSLRVLTAAALIALLPGRFGLGGEDPVKPVDSSPAAGRRQPAILFAMQPDERVARDLAAAGYVWHHSGRGNQDEVWTRSYLTNFNVVVLSHLKLVGPGGLTPEQQELVARLHWYVEQGGGLFVAGANDQDTGRCILFQNELLKPYGARVLREHIQDGANQYRQYTWTDRIVDDPLTQGVKGLFFPTLVGWGGTSFTNPIEVDPALWRVLVSAMPTAFSRALFDDKAPADTPATYAESPPFVAVREAGQGRVVLWPTLPTATFIDGYHHYWDGGLVLSGGVGHRTSQGWALMVHLLKYLAEPSVTTGRLGGFEPPAEPAKVKLEEQPGFQPYDWATASVPDGLPRAYKLLIGARTQHSSGQGTVAEYASEARKHGYDALVFAEDLARMTADKWERLRAECRENSTTNFLAVEGFQWTDEAGNQGIVYGDIGWIDESWRSETHPDRIKVAWHFHHAYAVKGTTPIAVINLKKNPKKPWFIGKTGGMAAFTYENGVLTDESVDLYLEMMRLRFDNFHLAVHLMDSPVQVALAAQPDNMQTFVRAATLADVITNMTGNWPTHTGWIWQVFVSNGPEIGTFQALNPGTTDLAVPGAERYRLRLKASSSASLKEVRLMDGPKLFRRFAADGKEFDRSMDFFHDRQRSFVAIVSDERGRQAISWCRWVEVQEQWFANCGDNWNYMDGGKWKGTRHADPRGSELTTHPASMDTTYAAVNGVVEGEEKVTNLTPPTSAVFVDKVMVSRFASLVDFNYAGLYGEGASWNINDFAKQQAIRPQDHVDFSIRRLFFTSRPDHPRAELYEARLKLKKPIKLSALRLASTSSAKRLPNDHISYADAGRSAVEIRPEHLVKEIGKRGILPKGGYVAVWPYAGGGVGVFSMDEGMRYVWYHSPPESTSFHLAAGEEGRECPAGHEVTYRYLTVVGPRFTESEGNHFMEWVKAGLGLQGSPWYNVGGICGTVLSQFYVLRLRAEDGGFFGHFTQARLPSDLPVIVEGLNERWQAGVWYRGKLRFMRPEWTRNAYDKLICRMEEREIEDAFLPGPVQDGLGYFGLDLELSDRDVFIGHPVVCDRPDIFLQLVEWGAGRRRVEVHNPTDGPVACTVQQSKGAEWLGGFERSVTVAAGTSEFFDVER